MQTTTIGKLAEGSVAKYMQSKGYRVIAKNWRTKFCEIDIVARKEDVIYFIEVKFRSSDKHGDGFEYITKNKLKQMAFAAIFWCQQNSWDGDYRLMAAAVDENQVPSIIEIS